MLLVAVPLMLAGIRVLGETNWAPISPLANVSQGLYGAAFPHDLTANMIGSGVAGAVPAGGEALMQNLRATACVGGRPRPVALVSLGATVLGALAVALLFPVLRERYGFGPGGLSSPISLKWASFAELCTRGLSALPPGCVAAMGVAIAVAVVITLLDTRFPDRMPSATGMGMAMLMPGTVVVPMVLGGLVQLAWARRAAASEAVYRLPLASGFIVGEALVGVAIPVLSHLKVIR
jgi:uncharacterized oligopeptide transporter (OPT) family protein